MDVCLSYEDDETVDHSQQDVKLHNISGKAEIEKFTLFYTHALLGDTNLTESYEFIDSLRNSGNDMSNALKHWNLIESSNAEIDEPTNATEQTSSSSNVKAKSPTPTKEPFGYGIRSWLSKFLGLI